MYNIRRHARQSVDFHRLATADTIRHGSNKNGERYCVRRSWGVFFGGRVNTAETTVSIQIKR